MKSESQVMVVRNGSGNSWCNIIDFLSAIRCFLYKILEGVRKQLLGYCPLGVTFRRSEHNCFPFHISFSYVHSLCCSHGDLVQKVGTGRPYTPAYQRGGHDGKWCSSHWRNMCRQWVHAHWGIHTRHQGWQPLFYKLIRYKLTQENCIVDQHPQRKCSLQIRFTAAIYRILWHGNSPGESQFGGILQSSCHPDR